MSFITRIAERSAPARNTLAPKGFARRSAAPADQPANHEEEPRAQPLRRQEEQEEQMQALRRQEEEEEMQAVRRSSPQQDDQMQTLRRQAEEEEEAAAQPVRRQAEEEEEALQTVRRAEGEDEDEERAQALRRQEEEEEALQTVRRSEQADEEQARALRRQEEEEEEEALQTVRRAEEEEEAAQPLRRDAGGQEKDQEQAQAQAQAQAIRRQEEEEDLQAVRRMTGDPASLDPDNSPFPEEMRDEPEPSALMALRREVAAPPAATMPTRPFDPGWSDGEGLSPTAGDSFARPSVHIDQLDVLIEEPSGAASGAGAPDRSRAIRTRYLRRI